ncbi:MAG TPA: hypothetical protein VGG25_15670 [Streptosporangiaceae bacterium]
MLHLAASFQQGGQGLTLPASSTTALRTGNVSAPGTYYLSADLSFFTNSGDTQVTCQVDGDPGSAQHVSLINVPLDDPSTTRTGLPTFFSSPPPCP